MAVTLTELSSELDLLLQPQRFNDYCPNGLQVEGKSRVEILVTGVTACQALLDAAVDCGADALLVHHGYFWRGENEVITGIKRQRIATLLQNDLNLFAFHLPLDAHPRLGNNAQLGKKLGLRVITGLQTSDAPIGNIGELITPMSARDFSQHIAISLQREPLHIQGSAANKIKSIAWCTGAAQSYIDDAIDAGVDAYLTGEVSEQTVHCARETGIHFFAAGHHATERYGVQAVGDYLAEKLDIQHRFIDIDNPV